VWLDYFVKTLRTKSIDGFRFNMIGTIIQRSLGYSGCIVYFYLILYELLVRYGYKIDDYHYVTIFFLIARVEWIKVIKVTNSF